MSFINKFAWSGVAVVLAVVLALGLMAPQTASAATTVAAGAKTISIATNTATGTGACTSLSSLVLSEAAAADTATGKTFILTTPTGWSWCASGTVTSTPVAAVSTTALATVAVVYTSTTVLTATTTGVSATAPVKFTWAGLGIRPDTAASATGNVALTGDGATNAAAAIVITAGGSVTGAYSINQLRVLAPGVTCDAAGMAAHATQPQTVPADGSASWVMCALVLDDIGNAAGGVGVTFVSSIGIVSTGVAKSVLAATNSTGFATSAYRGQGNAAATDTIIATFALKNAVATQTVTLVAASGGAATKIAIGAPNITAVAATVVGAPGYTSPTIGARSFIHVTDALGAGVNNQVALITVDRGSIVTGLNQACANVTAKSITGTTATVSQVPTGAATAGTIAFTLCTNSSDAAGKVNVTAQNISTVMANGTLSITNAGKPAKLSTTATANTITATVTDAAGNNVADGTPVRFTMSANAGAVSTACTTTTNGAATSVVALIASTGTVIVSTDWNEAGATVPGCVAAAAVDQASQVTATTGSQTLASAISLPGGASAIVPTTPAAAAPAVAGSGLLVGSGTVPKTGSGLIVFGGGTTDQLVTASGCAKATSSFYATNAAGEFVTFVPGTTIGAVNAGFTTLYAAGIPANTALIGKCA